MNRKPLKALMYASEIGANYREHIICVDSEIEINNYIDRYKKQLEYLENRAKSFLWKNKLHETISLDDVLNTYFKKLKYPLYAKNGIELIIKDVPYRIDVDMKVRKEKLKSSKHILDIEHLTFDLTKVNTEMLTEILNLLEVKGYEIYEDELGYKLIYDQINSDKSTLLMFDMIEWKPVVNIPNIFSRTLEVTPQEFLDKLKDKRI